MSEGIPVQAPDQAPTTIPDVNRDDILAQHSHIDEYGPEQDITLADATATEQADLEQVFSKVADFATNPDRKFAAGGDIMKATGMNHQKALELGFKDYADLEKSALGWKGEKDAAEAKESAQAAEEARLASYKEELASKDKAWRAERDQYRNDRDQKAKEALGAGSYKEMLENGGKIAYESRRKVAEEATKQPGVLIVPTNEVAEKRQAEYASMLRKFDKALLAGAKNSSPVPVPQPGPDKDEQTPDDAGVPGPEDPVILTPHVTPLDVPGQNPADYIPDPTLPTEVLDPVVPQPYVPSVPDESVAPTPDPNKLGIFEKLKISFGFAEKVSEGYDRVLIDEAKQVAAVFGGLRRQYDGGGSVEKARLSFSETFARMPVPHTVADALENMHGAYRRARSFLIDNKDKQDTYATATVVQIVDENNLKHLIVGHAGDNPIILWRDGQSQDVVHEHGKGGTAYNVLGHSRSIDMDEFVPVELQADDSIMIGTGKNPREFLSEDELLYVFSAPNPQESANRLMQLSGDEDDKSVIVIHVDDHLSQAYRLDDDSKAVYPSANVSKSPVPQPPVAQKTPRRRIPRLRRKSH